ncbi:MAG: translation initiation factor IF-3 [Chloroflexota bacterium]
MRVNQQIRAREVRVIGESGGQLGVMTVAQALQLAQDRGLDLVEVASTAVPPVCRLLDYGKYRYTLEKKERKARKGQKSTTLKEIRFRPRISDHDLIGKVGQIKKMLAEGNKVKVTVFLRGRENTHPELGWKAMRRVAESLKELAVVEGSPAMEGSNINLTFSPSKKQAQKPAKEPDKVPGKEKETVNA